MSRLICFGGLLAVVTLTAACAPAASGGNPAPAGPHAAVEISADKTTFAAGGPITLHVKITNAGSQTLGLLKWFTPFEGVERSLFTVQRDGTAVPYQGKMIKRAAPTGADYYILAAGEALSGDVDLAQSYDLSAPGTYTITYDTSSLQLFREEDYGQQQPSPDIGRLISNPLEITIK